MFVTQFNLINSTTISNSNKVSNYNHIYVLDVWILIYVGLVTPYDNRILTNTGSD